MDATIITIIFTAFGALLTAVFAGVMKLLKELRTILNGNSERRSIQAAERHGENMLALERLSDSMGDMKVATENHCSEQTELLREIVEKLT